MSQFDQHGPIGTTARREWRDLDTRRLPTAPPRPGSAPPRKPISTGHSIVADLVAELRDPQLHVTEIQPMSKTATILEHLKAHARGPSTALKPSQIGAELGGEAAGYDTSTVAALLRCAKKVDANEPLRHQKRGQALFWWWGEPAAERDAVPAEAVVQPGDQTYPLSAVLDDDHVLAAIHATRAAAHLPDADVHAKRLRALAESPILDGSIADWLHELADLIDYHNC